VAPLSNDMIHMIRYDIYLLKLGFHPLEVAGKLVKTSRIETAI